jgi:hypothetical protein
MQPLLLHSLVVALGQLLMGAVVPAIGPSGRLRAAGLAAALSGAAAPAALLAMDRLEFWLPLQVLLLAWCCSVLLAATLVPLTARGSHPVPRLVWGWVAAVLALDLWFAAAFLWAATVSAGGV